MAIGFYGTIVLFRDIIDAKIRIELSLLKNLTAVNRFQVYSLNLFESCALMSW